MLPFPDLSGFSEEERMQLLTVMKKAQVNFVFTKRWVWSGYDFQSADFPGLGCTDTWPQTLRTQDRGVVQFRTSVALTLTLILT